MPGGYESRFRIGGYAWKMNGNECGVTASAAPPDAI